MELVKLRLGTLLRVEGLAHWGSAYSDVTLGPGISMCKHAGTDDYVVCIKGQYIKGLLRHWCEKLAPLLRSRGVISNEDVITKVFGPSVLSGTVTPTSIPSLTLIGDAYPIKSIDVARKLFSEGEFTYLVSSTDVVKVGTELITRVRIDDVSAKAVEGALFHEVKLPLDTLLYSEVVIKDLSKDEVTDVARLILIALTQFNVSSPGRSGTTVRVKLVGIEPPELLHDSIIEEVMRWLR